MSRRKKKASRVPSDRQLEKSLIQLFQADRFKQWNYKQLAASLEIDDPTQRQRVIKVLAALLAQGQLEEPERGKYRYKHTDQYVQGWVDMTSKGAAYIVTDDELDDVFIMPRNLGHALHEDEVKVLLYAQRKNRQREGEVVEVIRRARTVFVGTVELSKNYGFLVPDSNKMPVDLYIPEGSLMGAKQGQKAIARLTDWPEKASSPFGEIIEVLGDPREHEVEIHAILAEYGLPRSFPPAVERAAEEIPEKISAADIACRRDFRSVCTFTIDPADAKDFDDALSYRQLENGHIEVGVHIADVTHYVQEGSALEQEAVERATSVYLVDRVVPMLPEKLSNQVCSLRPHEEKLCFSAVFTLNEKAEVLDSWFGRTVIYSDHRFAYEDAQAIIEGAEGPLQAEVLSLNALAKKLRQKRMQAGALAFERAEIKFKLDDKGNPTGVYFKEAKEANHLIEEFMLLANRSVAEFIGRSPDGKANKKTFVYRVHDKPDPDKLLDLGNFVKQFGYEVKLNNPNSTSQSLNRMLADSKAKAEANMIATLTIRSMAKADYRVKNIGHYGLAFDYYTHFTSPIRRYPDMMVHRLLQHYLDGKAAPGKERYEELCDHSSARERLATQAERDSTKYMQVKYMMDQEGVEFMGTISGVTEWGVFVELRENGCEGMVRIRDFKDDFYHFDEKNYRIVGQRSKKIYQLGDPIAVTLKKADLEKKQIDFAPL